MDDAGHGTHISGIIGARGNNSVGIVGLCWSVQIMPVKAMSRMWGTTSDVVSALNYAIDNHADIINASFSGKRDSRTMREAIRAAESEGIVVAAAAGNDTNDNDIVPYYPASYGFSNVIAIAATTRNDTLANYSNFGGNSVDLAAPGEEVYSTLPGDQYGVMSGTSMAAPHVAGAAALLLSQNPSLTPDQIRTLVMAGVDPVANLATMVESGGRLNVRTSLDLAAGPDTP
jgi:subtilisin family serine protease